MLNYDEQNIPASRLFLFRSAFTERWLIYEIINDAWASTIEVRGCYEEDQPIKGS